MVLSTAYLGNLHYFSKLLSGQAVVDTHENYLKQSFRNRCMILGANGVQTLTVPVFQPSGAKIPTREVRIDASKRWQHTHWQAIASAYRNSPFFFHYEEALVGHYEREYRFLVDLNDELQQTVLGLLGVNPVIAQSTEYVQEVLPAADFRVSISPKARLSQPDEGFVAPTYYQVFADRMEFVSNLSILDLLFCEGPDAAGLLKKAMRL